MNAADLDQLTQMGFAIAAKNIGYLYDHYRPAGASDPLDDGNLQGQLNAHFSIDEKLKRWSSYDNPLFTALVDGRVCQSGDYLTATGHGTYFIATLSTSPGMPILAVQCGRTVTISRPTSATSAAALMSAWPASIVRKGSRGTDESQLPGNIANPQWEMLLPAVAGVGLDVADVVSDDLLRLYFIEQAEHSGYGWRCAIKQLPPINGSTIYHYAQVVEATGKAIVFRRIVSTGGANPATNPVTGAITVGAVASIGATAVTLNAPAGNWTLEPGDRLTIGANVVTVATRTIAASGKFTAVPLSTALTEAVTVGQAVAVVWTNDFPVKAIIGSYESNAIDGTLVLVTDTRVLMQPNDVNGRPIPKPRAKADQIIIDGAARAVMNSNAQFSGESIALFDTQARG